MKCCSWYERWKGVLSLLGVVVQLAFSIMLAVHSFRIFDRFQMTIGELCAFYLLVAVLLSVMACQCLISQVLAVAWKIQERVNELLIRYYDEGDMYE